MSDTEHAADDVFPHSLICKLWDALGLRLYLCAVRTVLHLGFQTTQSHERFMWPWGEHPGHREERDLCALAAMEVATRGSRGASLLLLLACEGTPPKARQAACRAGAQRRPWSLTCPHMAFLSSLGLWLFLGGALKNDDWLLSQAPEVCLAWRLLSA